MRVVVTKRVGSRGEDRILSWSQGCWEKEWSNYFPRWHSDRGWGIETIPGLMIHSLRLIRVLLVVLVRPYAPYRNVA